MIKKQELQTGMELNSNSSESQIQINNQIFADPNLETGFEGTDSQTFRTPFIRILQTLSPELKKSDPKFLPNAEEGLFCNSATQECYKELSIVVLKIEHSLIIWKPDRGGFVGRYPKFRENEIVFSRNGVYKYDAEGNTIMDTIEFYCLNIHDPFDLFIFPMSAASLKHAKSFSTRLRLLKFQEKPVGVSWAGVWNISTIEESNEKGSWFTIGSTPAFVRFITKEEKELYILPAKDMLKTAVTDYSIIDAVKDQEEETPF